MLGKVPCYGKVRFKCTMEYGQIRIMNNHVMMIYTPTGRQPICLACLAKLRIEKKESV